MNDKLIVHGIILSSTPVGEADRRVVILSGECGRITAFARGARKPTSTLVASTRALTYGEITIYEGRNTNYIESINAGNFFNELQTDLEKSCYGSYFAEFANYYSQEGLEAKQPVRLLYAALLALSKGLLPIKLIQAIYELRMMTLNGDYTDTPFKPKVMVGEYSQATAKAWSHAIGAPFEQLFAFNLEEKPLTEFISSVEALHKYYIDREFNSLKLLDQLV